MFVFLGADLDAYAIARQFGIVKEATVSYSGRKSQVILREAAAVFSEFAHGRLQEVGFSRRAKRAAGDPSAAATDQGQKSVAGKGEAE